MIVHSPEGQVAQRDGQLAPRPASLQNLRVGLLDNTKAHANSILRHVGDRLQERFPGVEVIYRAKTHMSVPAEERVVAELRAASDVVLVALGD